MNSSTTTSKKQNSATALYLPPCRQQDGGRWSHSWTDGTGAGPLELKCGYGPCCLCTNIQVLLKHDHSKMCLKCTVHSCAASILCQRSSSCKNVRQPLLMRPPTFVKELLITRVARHTSTYAAEMQQRQPLLCPVAQIHFLESLVRTEPQEKLTSHVQQLTNIMQTEDMAEAEALVNHLKASLRSTSSLSLSWRSSSSFSMITAYDSPTFFFHSSSSDR